MHGVGAADRREESDGCQDDPESDEGANCAAESGGRGQAVRVGRSGHFRGERSRAAGLAPSAERCERPVARFGLDPPGGPAADCMAGRASGRQAGP